MLNEVIIDSSVCPHDMYYNTTRSLPRYTKLYVSCEQRTISQISQQGNQKTSDMCSTIAVISNAKFCQQHNNKRRHNK